MNINDIENHLIPLLERDNWKCDCSTDNNKIWVKKDLTDEYSINKIDKGYFIRKSTYIQREVPLKVKKDNRANILLDVKRNFKVKTLCYKLFIPNKGIPVLTIGRRLYLSLYNYIQWHSQLSSLFIRDIVKYSCPFQEWWLNHLEGHKFDNTHGYIVPLEIVRKCSSLQQYVNKVNNTGCTMKASCISSFSLGDITWLLLAGEFINNPTHLWENITEVSQKAKYPQNTTELLQDTVKMAAETNQKFTFFADYDRLRKQHDKILEKYLLCKEPVPLKVAGIFKDFATHFPDFQLIEEGNRLMYEGKTMKHCVASRSDIINRGEAGIYSLVYESVKYTLQLNKIKKQNYIGGDTITAVDVYSLYIGEIKGFANSIPTIKVRDYINECIGKFQAEIIEEKEDSLVF